MPKYSIKYSEKYSSWYDVEAANENQAEGIVRRKILDGEWDAPNHFAEFSVDAIYKHKEEDDMAQRYEYAVQVCYDRQYGYETVTTEDTMEEAEQMLRDYRENEPQYPSRIVRKKVTK